MNLQDENGFTCAHLAAKEGHTRIIQLLAKCEALLSLQDNHGQSSDIIDTPNINLQTLGLKGVTW